MLSTVLLLNPLKHPPIRFCSQDTPLAQNTGTNRIQSNITHLQYTSILPASYLRQLFTIQSPRSTRSSSSITLLRPCSPSSLKFANHSIARAAPLWNKLPPVLQQNTYSSYELT